LRKINPYKGSEIDQFLNKSLSIYKIDSIDILFFSHDSTHIFWTDHHSKVIQSLSLPAKNKVKREAGPTTIVSVIFKILDTILNSFVSRYLGYKIQEGWLSIG
jgi:hypothetical protein